MLRAVTLSLTMLLALLPASPAVVYADESPVSGSVKAGAEPEKTPRADRDKLEGQKEQEKDWQEYLSESQALYTAGKLSDAEENLDAALSATDKMKADSSRGDAYLKIAESYLHLQKFERAKALMEEGLKLKKGIGFKSVASANALDNLAQAYARSGDLTGASQKEEEALKIYESLHKTDTQDYVIALSNHANTLRLLKKFKESEPIFAKAVKIQQNLDGSNGDSEELAKILLNAVGLYCEMGKLDAAKNLLERSKKVIQSRYNPEHPLYKLSVKSERVYYKRLVDKLLKSNTNPISPQIADAVLRLAQLYEIEGDYSLASSAYKQALTIQERLLSPDSPELKKLEDAYSASLSRVAR